MYIMPTVKHTYSRDAKQHTKSKAVSAHDPLISQSIDALSRLLFMIFVAFMVFLMIITVRAEMGARDLARSGAHLPPLARPPSMPNSHVLKLQQSTGGHLSADVDGTSTPPLALFLQEGLLAAASQGVVARTNEGGIVIDERAKAHIQKLFTAWHSQQGVQAIGQK